MVHAGLDLSRRRLDVCLLSERGEVVRELSMCDQHTWRRLGSRCSKPTQRSEITIPG